MTCLGERPALLYLALVSEVTEYSGVVLRCFTLSSSTVFTHETRLARLICSGDGYIHGPIIICYASVKPSDPLHGYSYVHDSNLRQPRQIGVMMHKMLSVNLQL